MITTTDNEPIETFGNVNKHHEFKIKASARAFRVLSSSLYTDKIQAVLREYSCNCYDAHIAAKNPAPFKVHLPNRLEPFVSFRDYGTGLSQKDVFNIFTTYFQSSKGDSNDYVGCLGLGSKAGFSISDNFSVNSYFNGKKYSYTMFINEDGVPNVTLNGTTPTDEHNGLEITIGVRSNDFWSFSHNAAQVFKYFKQTPEITGETVIIEQPEYIIKGSSWGIRNNSRRDVKIIMGNVAYDLSNYYDDTLSKDVQRLTDLALDIYVDIGSVDVAASRESISFDKKTKLFIANKFNEIHKEITEKVSTSISSCQYLYDAKLMLKELHNSISYMSFENIQFNGKKLDTQYTYDSTKNTTFSFATLKNKSRRSRSYVEATRIFFEPSRNEVFLFMDTRKYAKLRYKRLSDNGNNATKYTIVKAGVNVDGSDMDHAQTKTDFFAFLGMNPTTVLKNMSEFPFDPPVKKVYTSTSGTTRTVKPRDQINYYDKVDSHWDIKPCIEEEENGETNVYMVAKSIMGDRLRLDYHEEYRMAMAINLFGKLNISIPTIYGIKESRLEKTLAKFPKLVRFREWVDQKIAEYVDQHISIDNLNLMHSIEAMETYPMERRVAKNILQNSFVLSTVKVDNPVSQKLLDDVKLIFKDSKHGSLLYIIEYARNNGIQTIIEKMDKINDVKKKENNILINKLELIINKEILPKYKLITMIMETYDNQKEHLKHYMELFK